MKITVISSSEIGIIGVGEGSTEHWRHYFQQPCNIDVNTMIARCAATHKYGIKFENWTTHTPTYYHSISGESHGPNDFNAVYSFAHFNDWLLTPAMITHLDDDKVVDDSLNPHRTTNQFHFDTFKLNVFLKEVAASKGVTFGEGKVTKVERNPENGFITSIHTDTKLKCEADFFVDASGFGRVLHSESTGNLTGSRLQSPLSALPKRQRAGSSVKTHLNLRISQNCLRLNANSNGAIHRGM